MSKIQEVAPYVWWAYEQVKEKFPHATIKMRWDPIMEAFVIATNNSVLDDSKEYSRFTWQLEDEIFPKSPYLLYFVYDSTLDDEDYDKEEIDIDVEKYFKGFGEKPSVSDSSCSDVSSAPNSDGSHASEQVSEKLVVQ